MQNGPEVPAPGPIQPGTWLASIRTGAPGGRPSVTNEWPSSEAIPIPWVNVRAAAPVELATALQYGEPASRTLGLARPVTGPMPSQCRWVASPVSGSSSTSWEGASTVASSFPVRGSQ